MKIMITGQGRLGYVEMWSSIGSSTREEFGLRLEIISHARKFDDIVWAVYGRTVWNTLSQLIGVNCQGSLTGCNPITTLSLKYMSTID